MTLVGESIELAIISDLSYICIVWRILVQYIANAVLGVLMNSTEFPQDQHQFLISGAVGALEVATLMPKDISAPITAVICHPHPLQGGTMDNKVVTTMVRTFRDMGICSVRFNFRGIGNSEGEFDNAIGEAEDLKAVCSWLKNVKPDDHLWLAGFSFGSYVASKVANNNPSVKQLINIAPAVTHYQFDKLTAIACPWLVVQGDEDEVITPTAVIEWAKSHKPAVQLIEMQGAGHFFHGRLIELRQLLQAALLPRVQELKDNTIDT